MPSWFDLTSIPVTDGKDHMGLSASADRVQSLIQEASRSGIPPDRIVLGGFSQGACLALHAGLKGTHRLAGIVALSGWAAAGLTQVGHRTVPIFVGHGIADDVVPCAAGRRCVEVLMKAGCSKVQLKEYRGLPHSVSPNELADVKRFLLEVLPKATVPAPFGSVSNVEHRTFLHDGQCRVEFSLECIAGIVLDVSKMQLRLSGGSELTVAWPSLVDLDHANARFLTRRKLLVVRAPALA